MKTTIVANPNMVLNWRKSAKLKFGGNKVLKIRWLLAKQV